MNALAHNGVRDPNEDNTQHISMRQMFGCATMIAAVAFVFGIIGSLASCNGPRFAIVLIPLDSFIR